MIPECQSEIIVLTDARQTVDPAAFVGLLENFRDPTVGAVSGELVFRARASGSNVSDGMNVYWAYEKMIRKSEAALHSAPGAPGALYAIRKDLFEPIPPDTLLDDVAIPMRAVARHTRCVFEKRARVYDLPSTSTRQEVMRKRRTIAGTIQLLKLYPQWCLPWRNPIWVQFISHKIMRLGSPFFLAGLLISSWFLSARPVYRGALMIQLCFYLGSAGSVYAFFPVRGCFLF